MHLTLAPTAPGPNHHGQHVPGHRTRRPGHIHPAQQVQGTRHPPPWGRIPRPGTASSKIPTAAHPGGQTDAGTRRGKKGPPTRHSPHHRPTCGPPTKGLRHGAPHRPGGASPPHHHRRPIRPRHPRTPLGPHSHPSDVPTQQAPKDPVTPLHIDQLLSPRATAHLQPSRIELAIASWDTLDTPPRQPAIHILKADAQWWVLHWAHGVLMAAQAYTPEKDLEDPREAGSDSSRPPPSQAARAPRGKPSTQRSTGLKGPPAAQTHRNPRKPGCLGQAGQGHEELPPPPPFRRQPRRTAMANRPPGGRAQARPPHAQPRESGHANAGRTPAKGSGPASNAPLLQTPLPPVPAKRARRKRGAPAPNQAGKAATSRPLAPPPTHPANPDQASSSSSLPPLPPPHPDQASSSPSLPPPAPPPPEAYLGFEKGAKVQQPFRNDHTGDWIWCEGTIQYRLREPGDNRGPQNRVVWHDQKQLVQGSSAPDKPEGHTLELTSAHPIRLHTDENKALRGTNHTGELPPEWSQGLPPPRLPKRPPAGKTSPGSSPPP